MERIVSRCPCGRKLVLDLLGERVTCRVTGAAERLYCVTRCPTCDRDFSGLTAEQVKDEVFRS